MKILNHFILSSNFKRLIIVLFLLFLYIIICAIPYVNAVSTNIQNSLFRLHVIANSDTDEDQNLKYLVRNNIINYINSISNNLSCKDEAINVIKNHITEIQKIAQQTIYENGYYYTVKLSIGNFPFPTKTYGDIALPAGFYDALKVEIGKAQGQNWWCVLFPPLCFVDITNGIVPENSKTIIKDNISEEEYNILSAHTNDINFKFKIIEAFQNIKIKLTQS